MGLAVCPKVMEEIVQRTASAMVSRGVTFSGVLFAGLMIKDGKVPACLGFSCTYILLHPCTAYVLSPSICPACKAPDVEPLCSLHPGQAAGAQRALWRPRVPDADAAPARGPAGAAPGGSQWETGRCRTTTVGARGRAHGTARLDATQHAHYAACPLVLLGSAVVKY